LGKVGEKKSYVREERAGKWGRGMEEGRENSTEILLTHRSRNRINQELELRAMEKERKVLAELIGYYLNESIAPRI
jgi:hypothetical protein